MARKHVIYVDGQEIEVTAEMYRSYKRSLWNENSRYRSRLKHECSLDVMTDSNMEPSSPQALVEDIVADRIVLETLFAALQTLDESERALINALYYEEKTVREVARALGVSHMTVHNRRHRILKKLREIFG